MFDIDHKIICIMKILSNSPEEVQGATVIARRLKDYGIELGERAVRYHLKLMDGQGLTRRIGRSGRLITELGIEGIKNHQVRDKVGFIITKIEGFAWQTDFNPDTQSGTVPINIAFFPKNAFSQALKIMRPVFRNGLCMSDMVMVVDEGQTIGNFLVPEGKTALVTISTAVFNGVFRKAGIHIEPKFSGILQIRNHKPVRFTELIHYAGCSLIPSELFISARKTTVYQAAKSGNGSILANFREIPECCWPLAKEILAKLRSIGMRGLLLMGGPNEPLCGITPEPNRVSMILVGGFNPIAAAVEAGIEPEYYALIDVVEYQRLVKFSEILNGNKNYTLSRC